MTNNFITDKKQETHKIITNQITNSAKKTKFIKSIFDGGKSYVMLVAVNFAQMISFWWDKKIFISKKFMKRRSNFPFYRCHVNSKNVWVGFSRNQKNLKLTEIFMWRVFHSIKTQLHTHLFSIRIYYFMTPR